MTAFRRIYVDLAQQRWQKIERTDRDVLLLKKRQDCAFDFIFQKLYAPNSNAPASKVRVFRVHNLSVHSTLSAILLL